MFLIKLKLMTTKCYTMKRINGMPAAENQGPGTPSSGALGAGGWVARAAGGGPRGLLG